MEPGGLTLLAGDASVDSWLREIHVPQAWHVYLVTGLDFREKIVLVLGRSEPKFAVSLLPYHFTINEGKMMKTLFPQNYMYMYVLRTTTTCHMVSFIDFYFCFLANFQT